MLCKEAYLFQHEPRTVQHGSQIHPEFRGTNTAGIFVQRALYFFYTEPSRVAYLFEQEPHGVERRSQMEPALRGANTAGAFLQRALYTLQRGLSIPTRAPQSATQVSDASST